MLRNHLLLFAFLVHLVSGAQSLTTPAFIGDHMVVQRDQPFEVYGMATPKDKVTVEWHGMTKKCKTDAKGKWSAIFDAVPFEQSNSNFDLKISTKTQELYYQNILVGDVWLASGQSNMEFKIHQGVTDDTSQLAGIIYPQIRYLGIEKTVASSPATSVSTKSWKVSDSSSIKDFSAVAYYFARRLYHELHVPIGIVEASYGGSSIEAWMSEESIGDLPHNAGPIIPDVKSGSIQ